MENLLSQQILNDNTQLKWVNSVSKEINWLNNVVANAEKEENEDIVERFTFMSNIKRSSNRKTDREEIRRRLAMGSDGDDYFCSGDRINRKPSLQSRLQSGMNLQICFMNENTSDTDSINSDSEVENNSIQNSKKFHVDKYPTKRPDSLPVNISCNDGPSCCINEISSHISKELVGESNFYKFQAQLQAEARSALVQAKEMAQMQMELEKQKQEFSPITDMIRKTLEKIGIPFSCDRRRLNRQMLTEMNIAQLQIVANDLHTKIETLNEKLVRHLIGRDDLHMEQDSMLVDIEDLTRDANRTGA
ncbi:hypothetical protein RUM43_008460 [Polyplax serrata]|uniref:Schwannomin interacting protein 1 C-terminal domain-containing protein n=1 Tax=Polyplax serrata TaxID=468196 RepID=A0AAN8P9D8_POLSC